MSAHMAQMEASNWLLGCPSNRSGTADQGEKRIVGSSGSHMTGTGSDRKNGSHVVWEGKPLTRGKKGIAGSWNRKSRGLGWETTDQMEKGIVGAGWGKTAEERGHKVQSPIQASGVVPGLQKKNDAMLENKK